MNVKQKKLIAKWEKISEQLKELKAEEKELREKISAALIPKQVEGTQTFGLSPHYSLVVKQTYNRKINEDELQAALKGVSKAKAKLLVNTKPSLVKSVYNDLTEKERRCFDKCLLTTPALPSMEIRCTDD